MKKILVAVDLSKVSEEVFAYGKGMNHGCLLKLIWRSQR